MKTKPVLVCWLLVLNALVICCVLFSHFNHKHREDQRLRARADEAEQKVLRHDVISQSDWQRLREITRVTNAREPLTDEQLLLLLSQKTRTYQGKTSPLGSLTADIALIRMKILPPTQKALLYRSLLPALSASDIPHASGMTDLQYNKLMACDLLARLKVREAVPNILPLLDDPNPQTRNVAKRDLHKLGYDAL